MSTSLKFSKTLAVFSALFVTSILYLCVTLFIDNYFFFFFVFRVITILKQISTHVVLGFIDYFSLSSYRVNIIVLFSMKHIVWSN